MFLAETQRRKERKEFESSTPILQKNFLAKYAKNAKFSGFRRKYPHPAFGHPLPCMGEGKAFILHPFVLSLSKDGSGDWIPAFAGMT